MGQVNTNTHTYMYFPYRRVTNGDLFANHNDTCEHEAARSLNSFSACFPEWFPCHIKDFAVLTFQLFIVYAWESNHYRLTAIAV